MQASEVRQLEKIAWQIRGELVRMFSHGRAHHFGGSLSCSEIVAALYFHRMRFSAALKDSPDRDRFIMSKGHTVPAQYVALSMLGIIPPEELATIKRLGSRLQGHPDILKTPGIEAPTGSLGQGLSYANGLALAGRLDGLRFNVYLILGDGELQEGQVWEAAMTTSHYRLHNVCVIVDRNRYQSQGDTEEMMAVEPIQKRWEAFGWETLRVDGHDVGALCEALDRMGKDNAAPLAIVADTVKGKGVSFMENTYKYHNASITEAQCAQAAAEIAERLRSYE